MKFTFEVTIELTREQGKFITKDDLAEQLQSALDDANPQTVEVEESSYNVDSWEVNRAAD